MVQTSPHPHPYLGAISPGFAFVILLYPFTAFTATLAPPATPLSSSHRIRGRPTPTDLPRPHTHAYAHTTHWHNAPNHIHTRARCPTHAALQPAARRYLSALRKIGMMLLKAANSFAAIALLIVLFWVIFAIMGLHVFGGTSLAVPQPYPNFDTFLNSLVSTFNVRAWLRGCACVRMCACAWRPAGRPASGCWPAGETPRPTVTRAKQGMGTTTCTF